MYMYMYWVWGFADFYITRGLAESFWWICMYVPRLGWLICINVLMYVCWTRWHVCMLNTMACMYAEHDGMYVCWTRWHVCMLNTMAWGTSCFFMYVCMYVFICWDWGDQRDHVICTRACLHTHIHTYKHTEKELSRSGHVCWIYIHHAYIHTYIHTYMLTEKELSRGGQVY